MGVSWKKSGKNLYQRWGRLEQVSRASNRDVVDCGDARVLRAYRGFPPMRCSGTFELASLSVKIVEKGARCVTLRVEVAKFAAAKQRAKPQNKQIHRGLRLSMSRVRRENRGLARLPAEPGSSRKK